MKKTQRSLLALSCMAAIHGTASAAPPVAFNSWSAGAKGISSTCPSRFVCTDQVNGTGMMQRMIVDDKGKRYYQTVVYDKMTDGTTMSNESFVMGGNGTSGISTKQMVSTVTGKNTMSSDTTINSGWASSSGLTETSISQNITSAEIAGVGYTNSFFYESTQNASDKVTGYYMAMRQEVLNSTKIGGDVSASGKDKNVFELRQAKGDRVKAGSINVPAPSGGMMGGMGGMGGGAGDPAGGTVTWKVGNEVQAIYIGQLCEGCATGGMMGGGGGGGGMGGGGGGMGGGSSNAAFSYNSFDNLSDSSAAAATRSYTSTGNIVWTTQPFGAVPKF